MGLGRQNSIAIAFAIFSSCTCSKKEQIVTALSGPVEASLVRVDKTSLTVGGAGHGHVGVLYPTTENSVECELRVTKPKSLTIGVAGRCEDNEMVADAQRLAFGPPKGKHRVLYFGGSGRSFESPDLADGPVDWAKVPPLADALEPIFRETLDREEKALAFTLSGGNVPDADFGEAAVDEILETKKSSGLAAILDATKDAPFRADTAQYRGLWHRAFLRADEPDRETVRKRLLDAIKLAMPKAMVLARAIREIDLSGAAHDAMLLARLRELVKKKDPEPIERDIAAVLFRRTANGSVACQFLGGWKWDSVLGATISDDAGAALLVIANTKTACPAMRALFDEAAKTPGFGLCTERTWFCPESDDVKGPRTRCPDSVYADRVKTLAMTPWNQLQEKLGTIENIFVPALVLARALAGPLPAVMNQSLARQSYAWQKPSITPCKAASPGQACAPNWSFVGHVEICDPLETIPLASNTTEGALRYDDAKRTRWFEGVKP